MIIPREIGSSYHHKPLVEGVDYSSLMVESKEGTLVKEKRRPEAILATFPPLIFVGSASLVVSCFSIDSSREHLEGGGSLYRDF
jgi:hypothetical protein